MFFYFAKIMQAESRTSSQLECYAEARLILCKDSKKLYPNKQKEEKVFYFDYE